MPAFTTFVSEDVLILTKTYPTPSRQYRETSCIAGVTRKGAMRRLFPIPFRLLQGADQFAKWEWIRIQTGAKTSDPRPESRKIETDAIIRLSETVDASDGWAKRLPIIEPHLVSDPDALEARRRLTGETLGFVEPSRCVALEITAADTSDWSPDELVKLRADGLFDSDEVRNRTELRKVPFDFRYRYECLTPEGPKEFRHKVTDWELGALYWKCWQNHGPQGWEASFRKRAETWFFAERRMLFLLGTMLAHPHRWLIVGLVYPPTPPAPPNEQQLDLL